MFVTADWQEKGFPVMFARQERESNLNNQADKQIFITKAEARKAFTLG